MTVFARLRASHLGPAEPLRVLAASGQLGFGIPEPALRAGFGRAPHVIAADMGSLDPGPAYLGSDNMAASPALARRDLRLVLEGALACDAPLLIGSAGTAGAAPHLAATEALLREVAREAGVSLRLATIAADIPPDLALRSALTPIGPIDADIDGSAHIVAQMGMRAMLRALDGGADVVLAGRACDTAPFAAVPVALGFDKGLAMHMAKILECTSLACTPGGRDAMLATMEGDAFTLESMNPARAATPLSVAAHALYEQADPHRIDEPGGWADLSAARYEAVDARRCRVSGTRWHDASALRVKIEGAGMVGHRTLLLAAAADPTFIAQSEALLAGVDAAVAALLPRDPEAPWQLSFRRYGIDGVTDWPAAPDPLPRELFLLGEILAPDQDTARSVAAAARQHLLHLGFEGRQTTAGNLAFPVAPPELDTGPAYAFTLHHLMAVPSLDALDALFPITYHDL